jgi:hypothetical protein
MSEEQFWEYWVEDCEENKNIESRLNELGTHRWELVAMVNLARLWNLFNADPGQMIVTKSFLSDELNLAKTSFIRLGGRNDPDSCRDRA